MIKNIIITSIIFSSLAFSENIRLNLDDVVGRYKFKIASLGVYEWIPGQDAYIKTKIGEDNKSLYKIDLVKNDTTLFLDSTAFYYEGRQLTVKSFKFNGTGTKLLLQTEKERIWRHSYWSTYFIINLENLEIIPVSKQNTRLRNAKFSPDGQKIAYVREDNNLYVYDLNKKREKKLTRSGSENIINGHRGWVYEEEFGSFDAYRWSFDSGFIAYWEEDQSNVPEFLLFDEMKLYPVIKKIRYPKAGQTNPTLKIAIVNISTAHKQWIDTGENVDAYYPWMEWSGKSELMLMSLNRLQKKFIMLNINSETGLFSPGIIEEDSSGWVDIHGNYNIMRNDEILWISEKTGYQHIFRHDSRGNLIKQLTSGDWEVTKIVEIDQVRRIVYFLGNKTSAAESKLYSVDFDGNNFQLLTPESGSHSITFSPSGKYLIDSYSNFNTPRKIILKHKNGKFIRILKETDKKQFDEYNWSIPHLVNFMVEDSSEMLDGIITLPVDYAAGKKYPVIIYGYGMPGTQIVRNRWGGVFNQYLAQAGYIVFSMDTRGMSGRGEKFKNLSYGNMAKYLALDQIAGIKWLIDQGYADQDRIGAWGWSGGGYFTGLMLTKNAEYFKAGVAVAPVTDFRLYDSIYTERSMGLPETNQAGYDSTSIMTYAGRIKGKLLIMHGTGDDNVHSQNTSKLAQAFIKANKPVDVFFYPNRKHGIYSKGAQPHLYAKLMKYFEENL